MELYYLKNNLLLSSLGFVVLSGALRYRSLDEAMKLFWLIFCVSLVGESAAYYAALRYHHNLKVYAVSSIAGIFVTCLYFNYSIGIFRKYHIGIVLAIASVMIGIVSNFIIQSTDRFPSYFLHYQALIIIVMAMFSLTKLLQDQRYVLVQREPHFWACTVLLFFWCLSYFNWTLFEYYSEGFERQKEFTALSMFTINLITNITVTILFFITPKMQRNG